MRNKILSATLLVGVLSSVAFANDAVKLSNEMFAFKKDASQKELKVLDECDKIHDKMLEATKNMTPKQKDEFFKDFKMQMRKNMASLGRDEYFNPRICAPKKAPRNYGYGRGDCPQDCPMNDRPRKQR